MKNLEKRIKRIDGGDVLDVATGRGEFIEIIKEFRSYNSVCGIDISAKAAEAFSEAYPDDNITYKSMDAAAMDFPADHFDTVCISNSLHHIPDIVAMLSEMKRVLKPGGTFIINEMFADGQSPTQETHNKLHQWWAEIDTLMGITHNPIFSREQIKSLVADIGLSEVDVLEYSWEVDDPKDAEMIEHVLKGYDLYAARVVDNELPAELLEKGKRIKERLLDIGFAPSASLFITGVK